MTKEFLYQFIIKNKLAVLSTVSGMQQPEAALVGIAVTTELHLVFDTVSTSRKYQNLVNNPSVALVIGWDKEQTLQYEGQAKIHDPTEPDDFLETYFRVFPDGRERKATWKDLVYFHVVPKWIRYSDFNEPQRIEEMTF
jgi:pyridoxine/pyridoxamine 5'-phosphate oxidase